MLSPLHRPQAPANRRINSASAPGSHLRTPRSTSGLLSARIASVPPEVSSRPPWQFLAAGVPPAILTPGYLSQEPPPRTTTSRGLEDPAAASTPSAARTSPPVRNADALHGLPARPDPLGEHQCPLLLLLRWLSRPFGPFRAQNAERRSAAVRRAAVTLAFPTPGLPEIQEDPRWTTHGA